MLVELNIENFAIIDKVRLSLVSGFNAMTGETGAGKSILIDAVGALLGSKIGADFVRAGCDSAHVEAIFDFPQSLQEALAEELSELGLDISDGNLIISRDVYQSGRTTSRINGRAVTQTVLQQVGQRLIDIHGQSEHLSLLRTAEHIEFLDRFAGLQTLRAEIGKVVADLRKTRREIQGLLQDERETARKLDLLQFQVQEILSAKLVLGEEDHLLSEQSLLANAERIKELAGATYGLLREGIGNQSGITDLLGEASSNLADLARLDPSLEEQSTLVQGLSYQLEDVARFLRSYRETIEYNPNRLIEVEDRIELIQRLKRKYGGTIEEIIEFGKRAGAELEAISNVDERLNMLRDDDLRLLRVAGEISGRLTDLRQKAGKVLSKRIESELADLNMTGTRFEVSIRQIEAEDGVPVALAATGGKEQFAMYAFDATGIDKIEFLLSPNPGEPLKSLARVASGGETSRLMLAMKTVLSEADALPTLIFDEIDVGVGGRSGVIVGQKLHGLSKKHQVLCVTHLPQIAAFADAHFNIAKGIVGDRMISTVKQLSDDERIEELAQMLGGATETTRSSAREMIANSRITKR